jgi:hypothetical protein
MSGTIRDHLRSNVVAYVALFLLLSGGTAFATHPGGENTISSEDIINGQVKQADVGLDAVNSSRVLNQTVNDNDLAPASVKGPKVLDDSLTGADVLEPSLSLAGEGWNEVGDGDGPPFFNWPVLGFDRIWGNFSSNHNPVAFRRDRQGFVHLKGLFKFDPDPDCNCLLAENTALPWRVFMLPPGYRPAAREVHLTLQQGRLSRIDIGDFVVLELIGADMGKGEWASLDGITFRCAPSGVNGCP